MTKASTIHIPQDLRHVADLRAARDEAASAWVAVHAPADLARIPKHGSPAARGLWEGEWPSRPPPSAGLALDHRRKPLGTVHVMLLPIRNGAEAPAHLRWGNWGACPAAEYHVAMLRSWRERYGAELVGAGGLDLNLRVARRPRTVEEAITVAREQMAYCENAIFNGITTVQALAASLMANDRWYFWWDS